MAVAPRIGTEFAGYRIEALLGRGGMSVVYRAENIRLGNKVALKLLSEELADDESFRERFVRESRTAATLNHPNIVTIYDAGDSEGLLYIAMRLVDGDLKAHLRREGPLAPDHALAIAAQVGSALDAAHARSLLHRDVKPANILLEPGEPGAPPHAYLADFGLTKHLESRSGITASGQFVGTIDYMSPEQIEGREVDGRTDIYSLGCVLFECLTRATPFRRETEVAVLWAHMREDPPAVTELRPELPGAVDLVVARAVAKDPDNRYATARELVDELQGALEGVPDALTRAAVAEPTQPTRAAPRAVARQRWRWILPVVALAALLVGSAIGIGAYELITDPETRVVTRTRTERQAAYDPTLLSYVPTGIEHRCVSMERLTPDFRSSLTCPLGNAAAMWVQYHQAESGEKMRRYFERRVWAEDLGKPGERFQPRGHCGRPPALRDWRRRSTGVGHEPVEPGEETAGRFMCYRRGGGAARGR